LLFIVAAVVVILFCTLLFSWCEVFH